MSAHTLYSHFLLCVPTVAPESAPCSLFPAYDVFCGRCLVPSRLKFSLQVSTATTATCLLRQRTVRGGLQVASRVRAKACRDIPPLLQWSKFYEAAPELSAPQGATSPPNVNVARRFTRYHRLKSGWITSFPGSRMHALRKDFLRVCRRASLLFSKPSAVSPLPFVIFFEVPRVPLVGQ
ncbi:hypothetical protein B0H14DRAFT_3178632 [Mycena olivaceomarginata]|nr:hypothetical protein B0H14DRAFT_3178632 [Mycena olivaceomarginata]